jgi:hypothetical protein|tara:strand:+ start:34 stop:483 length:450 start_codon:yes stop_codon:yes gene_type:complete
MGRYKHHPLKNTDCALYPCLQSILELRRFQAPDQGTIAEFFEKPQLYLGFQEVLDQFLREYDLSSDYYPTLDSDIPPSILLDTELNAATDVLAIYSGDSHQKFSIVLGYEDDRITLQDPENERPVIKSLDDLTMHMGDTLSGQGFYVIY